MTKNSSVAPILKWVGGKRQILDEIKQYVPEKFNTYHEPFLGGGAVLFDLQPDRALANDVNPELMNVYMVIKNNVEELIQTLKRHDQCYRRPPEAAARKYFYRIRELDRSEAAYNQLTPVQKAARTIFLNRTCFNGLFRVNRAGQFNTPFGYYKNPNIINEKTVRAVSDYFNRAAIKLCCEDFEIVLKQASEGDFVYLDPPYDPLSDTASFTEYDRGGFGSKEQIRLSRVCQNLDQRGIMFLLSNSATDFVNELYRKYPIETIQARRAVNARGDGRGEVDEVLVRNFEP